MRIKKILQNLSLLIFTVVLFIFCSEVILRYVWTGWKTAWDKTKNFCYSKEVDIAHFRQDIKMAPKKQDEFRIIVLGDSLSWGDKIDDEQKIWPRLLEAELKEADINARVFNMSICGFTTVNELELLMKQGLKLDPDLVIVGYCLNDSLASGKNYQRIGERKVFGGYDIVSNKPLNKWLKHNLYAYNFLNQRKINLELKLKNPSGRYYKIYEDDYPGWLACQDAFMTMGKLREIYDLPFVVMVFPAFEPGVDKKVEYSFTAIHDKVLAVVEKAGIYGLDLLPFYLNNSKDLKEFYALPLEGHPNEKAHLIAAEAVYEFLITKDLIQQEKESQ